MTGRASWSSTSTAPSSTASTSSSTRCSSPSPPPASPLPDARDRARGRRAVAARGDGRARRRTCPRPRRCGARRALPRAASSPRRAAGRTACRRSIPARARRSTGWRRAPATLLGVATGKARRGLDHLLAAHGLGRLFVDRADRRRPPVEAASLDAPRRPRRDRRRGRTRAVMVGDTEFDIAMGRAAGMATIGVAWGYHPRARLAAAGADVIIDELRRARRRPRPPRAAAHELDPAPPLLGPRRGPPRGGRLRRQPRRAAAARRPAGAALVVPTEALAAAIAAEWDALDGEIRPERLPLTRAANSAIDRVAAAARGRSSTRSPTTARPICSATAPPRPRRSPTRQAAALGPLARLGRAERSTPRWSP